MQDFWAFHAAAEGAANGAGALLYDRAYFQALFPHMTGLLWLYPPTMLIFLEPFGALAYGDAKLIWVLINFIGVVAAAYYCSKENIVLAALAVLSPAFYVVLYTGQLSVVFAILLAAGLVYSKTRPLLAGLCLGLLSVKPQLGLLVPFFLVFNGAWRAFFSAGVVATLLCVGALMFYGVEVWTAFLRSIVSTHIAFSQTAEMNGRVAFIDVLRLAGITPAVSLAIAFTGLGLSLMTIRSAISNGASMRALSALTMMLIVVTAPYLWIYEWVFVMLATLLFFSTKPVLLRKSAHVVFLCLWYAPLLPYLGGGLNYAPVIWLSAAMTTFLMYDDIRRQKVTSLQPVLSAL